MIDFRNMKRASEIPLSLVAPTEGFTVVTFDQRCQLIDSDFFSTIPNLAIHFQVTHVWRGRPKRSFWEWIWFKLAALVK